jgi:hypothetical protein
MRQRSSAKATVNSEQCAAARVESEQALDGAPDCPVAHMSEAPTVEP